MLNSIGYTWESVVLTTVKNSEIEMAPKSAKSYPYLYDNYKRDFDAFGSLNGLLKSDKYIKSASRTKNIYYEIMADIQSCKKNRLDLYKKLF